MDHSNVLKGQKVSIRGSDRALVASTRNGHSKFYNNRRVSEGDPRVWPWNVLPSYKSAFQGQAMVIFVGSSGQLVGLFFRPRWHPAHNRNKVQQNKKSQERFKYNQQFLCVHSACDYCAARGNQKGSHGQTCSFRSQVTETDAHGLRYGFHSHWKLAITKTNRCIIVIS